MRTTRRLATIQKIDNEVPIQGKDKIVLATMEGLGWQVIVQKDQIKVGDLVVFAETDSVFPEKPEFEFLRSKKFRIKTMKMGGVLSQGICFPLNILPEGNYKQGDDVTKLLGITQYEPTMDIEKEPVVSKKRKYPKFLMRMEWFRKLVLPKKENKGFPDFLSKTDETRIQNAPFYLQMDKKWIETEKIDGQSGTFALKRIKSKFPFVKDKFEYIVCSRNLRLWEKDNSSYWKVSDRYNIENFLRNTIGDRDWIAIQGECIAPNVQGNKYHVTEADLYVFNLIYPTGRLGSEIAKNICEQHGLKFVPIVNTNVTLPNTVNEILDYVTHDSVLYPTLREGSVFRSKDGKLSFKAVSPDFLIKHNE